MEEKVCNHHKNRRHKKLRRFFAVLLLLIFIILLTFLIIWAVLQPKKPRFLLQDATVFSLNISAANVLSTTLQVTVNSHNPNSRIGIYYDKLDVYATYSNQQITYFTVIPPVYQGHKDVNIWSPFLSGTDIPIAPYNGPALIQDKNSGGVRVMIKIDGRLKWKVGSFTSGRYRLHVTCRAFIPVGNSKSTGIFVGDGVKYQISQRCSVSV